MKPFKTIIYCLSLISFSLGADSCQKDAGKMLLQSKDTLPANVFPDKIGYRWTYRVYDSLSSKTDTVDVNIVGRTIYKGDSAAIWLYKFHFGNVDTSFVVRKEDSVKIYDGNEERSEPIYSTVYLFPMQDQKTWRVGIPADSILVNKVDHITVAAGNFNNVFEIKRRVGVTNYYLTENEWFVPELGIIKRYEFIIEFGILRKRTWELISVNFNS